MRILIQSTLLALLLISPRISRAELHVSWVRSIASIGEEYCRSTVSRDGYIYVTGGFSKTMIVESDTLVSAGGSDVFVAKYTLAGTLVWIRQAGSAHNEYGYGVAVDAQGNVVITGGLSSSISFGDTVIKSGGIFLAKYDSTGKLLWARGAGGACCSEGFAVDIDASNNIYIVGDFEGTAQFEQRTVVAKGGRDVFVARYDASGNIQWVTSGGSTADDIGLDITVVNDHRLYITGQISKNAKFGNSAISNAGLTDMVIVAYDAANGGVLWAQSAGGATRDIGQSITASTESVYIAGYFSGTGVFGNRSVTSSGKEDGFLACYNAEGDIKWVTNMGGIESDLATGVCLTNDKVIVSGGFSGIGHFGDTVLSSNSTTDGFLACYDTTGTLIDVLQVGKGIGTTIVFDVAANKNTGSDICFTGSYSDAVSIGDTTLYNIGGVDYFVGNLTQVPTTVENTAAKASSEVIIDYSNTSYLQVIYNLQHPAHVQISLVDLFGRQMKTVDYNQQYAGLHNEVVEVSDIAPGIYFVLTTINGRSSAYQISVLR